MQKAQEDADRVHFLWKNYSNHLVKQLPPVNRQIIKEFFHFLNRWLQYEEVTKMNAQKFATVLAPILLTLPEDGDSKTVAKIFVDLPLATGMLSKLIQFWSEIEWDVPVYSDEEDEE